MKNLALLSLAALLGACAPKPVSPERAEALCRQDARGADGVSGNVGVGVGTGGARAKGSITIDSRVLNPQTEDEFLAQCIQRRIDGRPAPTRFGITLGAST